MRPLLLLALVACEHPYAVGPSLVGVGLDFSASVRVTRCDDSIVNESCNEESVKLRSARSPDDLAEIVEVRERRVSVRALRPGLATLVIETENHGCFELGYEAREIDIKRFELAGTTLGELYSHDNLAYFTDSTLHFRSVHQYVSESGSAFDLSGRTAVSLDPGDTAARLLNDDILADVETGPEPGTAALSSASGIVLPLEIVGIDAIRSLELIHRDQSRTAIALGHGTRVRVVPLTADGRAIGGVAAERPTVAVDSPVVSAELAEQSNFIDIDRLEPGLATVTVTWGEAAIELAVSDPT